MADDVGDPERAGRAQDGRVHDIPMTTAVADVADREVDAFRGLLERWFDSCVDVAWQVLHDADTAATVAQDTFFAAWHAHTARKPPAEAAAWVLRAVRDGALGRLGQARHRATGAEPPSSGPPIAAGAKDRDAGADLVRATFAALGAADASVLDLHLRHGFGVPELAQALGVRRHDAQELVLRLNRKLGRALRAWALWPESRPGGSAGCSELRQALGANGVRTFGPDAVAEIARHAKACVRCQDRQRLGDSPEATYAAVPVVPAGTMLAAATAKALVDRGIPLDGEPSSTPPAPIAPSPAVAVVAVSAHVPAVTHVGPTAYESPDTPTATTWAAPVTTAVTSAAPAGDRYPPTGDAGHDAPGDGPPAAPPPPHGRRRSRKALAAVAIAAVLATGAAAAVGLTGGGEDDPTPTTAPSTTADSTSTTTSEATTTTAGPGTTASHPAATTTAADGSTTTTAGTGQPATIVGFRVASVTLGRPCADAERRITLTWQATDADGVRISGEGAPAGTLPVTGQATACRGSGPPVAYTLTASGPGGTDTATVSA